MLVLWHYILVNNGEISIIQDKGESLLPLTAGLINITGTKKTYELLILKPAIFLLPVL